MANLNELMFNIAEAIRHKRNITDKINAQDFPNEIEKITGGGSDENSVIKRLMSTGVSGLFNNKSDNNLLCRLNNDDLKSLLHYDDTSELTSLSGMFGYNSKITTIPLLNTSKVTDMSEMFNSLTKLQNVPQFDTSKVTNMSKMFYNCTSLTSIPQFNTSKVTDMGKMFCGCSNLTSIPQLDTSSVTNMRDMFYNCESLTSIPQLDTNKVLNMEDMFNGCTSLTTLPVLDLSHIWYAMNMFSGCTSLVDLPPLIFPISGDTNRADYMFNGCTNLNFHQLDLKNIYYARGMFSGCNALTSITNFKCQWVFDMSQIFQNCSNLKDIVISSCFGWTSPSPNISSAFQNCYMLKTIDMKEFTDKNGSFASNCYSLTKLIIRSMDTIPTLISNAFNNCYHFTGTVNANYNPDGLKDGIIYVPDDKVEELKAATNWSVYADIIQPVSIADDFAFESIDSIKDESGQITTIDNLTYTEV